MKRFMILLVAALLFVAPSAHAQTLEVWGAAGGFPFGAGVALREFALGDVSLEANISTRSLGVGLGTALDFGPAGRVGFSLRGGITWNAALLVSLETRGTLGPLALALRGQYAQGAPTMYGFASTALLAPFGPDPDPTPRAFTLQDTPFAAWLFAGSFAYRLERTLILNLEARYANINEPAQPSTQQLRSSIALEYRERDYRVAGGAVVVYNPNVFSVGFTLAGRYAPRDAPYRLEASVLLGVAPQFAYGATAQLGFDLPDEAGTLGIFVAYEPFRSDVTHLRFGLDLDLTAGPGTAFARAYGGGWDGAGINWGVMLGYRLSLEGLLNP